VPTASGATARGRTSTRERRSPRSEGTKRGQSNFRDTASLTAAKGFVFDVDGTLIDSNDAHAHAWQHAFLEAGPSTGFEQIRRLIGKGSDKLLAELAGIELHGPRGQQLSARKTEIFKAHYLPHLKPFPQARELLLHVKQYGTKLAVATSASPHELDALLAIVKAEHLFEVKITGEQAGSSKPDPDSVSRAVSELGLRSAQCVMVGDTPYDAAAARRAGVAFIGLRCGGWRDGELQPAIAVYSTPAELLKALQKKAESEALRFS
jgi:HAD superfamily hydrolase (TIGR01509 family)